MFGWLGFGCGLFAIFDTKVGNEVVDGFGTKVGDGEFDGFGVVSSHPKNCPKVLFCEERNNYNRHNISHTIDALYLE